MDSLHSCESFTTQLIAAVSVNGQNNEEEVCYVVVKQAEKLGLSCYVTSKNPKRPNVVVSVGEATEPARFAFVAHVDTVNADAKEWDSPPFEACVKDGKLIGRGACDNKGGLVCALLALQRLKNVLKKGMGRVLLVCVSDEESGACSSLGLKHVIEQGILKDVEGAVYCYPNRNITIGHRGLLRLKIHVKGVSIHSGSSRWASGVRGSNAMATLCEIVYRIDNYNWEAYKHPSFPNLKLTVTPTLFQSGQFESIVPAEASVLVDIRLMPDSRPESIRQKIQEISEEVISQRNKSLTHQNHLSFSMSVKNELPACFIDKDHKLVASCVHALESVTNLDSSDVTIGGCGPANEGYMLINKGIPTICGFGPIGGNAHVKNEWVNLKSMEETVLVYCEIVEHYLGL